MKILYIGDLCPGQTCRMRMRALVRLGHDIRGVDTEDPWKAASWVARQWQRRARRGSIVDRINREVREAAEESRPALLWADKQQYLRAETLEAVSKLGCRTVHFTPDPYFSLPWKRTPLMDAAMQQFDGFVCTKTYEMPAYEGLDKPVFYSPLGYCDEVHRPLPTQNGAWNCEVGFLGGWEPRREHLLSPLAANEVQLKIWGGYWEFLADGRWSLRRHLILNQLAGDEQFRIHRDPGLARCLQGGEVYGDDYARALTGARIGLGFLRKVCPDQHTTRSFEIPACGSMLLADRTAEHQALFEEGKEAEYFDSPEELQDKVDFFRRREPARARIAAAGRKRCEESRYAYIHRMKIAMEWITTEAL